MTTTRISIEPASVRDTPSLVRLGEAFYGEAGYPFQASRYEHAMRVLLSEPGHGFVWIITDANEPVGYIVLTLGYSLEYLGCDAFIDELYVRPEYRRRGIGRRAFEVVAKAARRFEVRALHLEVERENDKALELYRKMGFEAHDRLLMTKLLDRD